MPLAERLAGMIDTGELQGPTHVATFATQRWRELVDATGLPADVEHDRADAYVDALERSAEALCPARALVARLESSEAPGAASAAKKGGTSYIFVTDGIEAALARARQAAGSQDVQINGGADVAQQFLNAGLIDEIRLHLVPIILGAGTRLFDGVRTDVRLVPGEAQDQPAVTHLVYDVGRPTPGV